MKTRIRLIGLLMSIVMLNVIDALAQFPPHVYATSRKYVAEKLWFKVRTNCDSEYLLPIEKADGKFFRNAEDSTKLSEAVLKAAGKKQTRLFFTVFQNTEKIAAIGDISVACIFVEKGAVRAMLVYSCNKNIELPKKCGGEKMIVTEFIFNPGKSRFF